MFRRMFILSIVCVCALTVVSAGRERVPAKTDLQHRFDRNRDGNISPEEQALLREFSEARERIEGLVAEAREAEEKARRMRAEAEEIERSLQRRFRGPQSAEAKEGTRRHLAELKEAAARAEREGRGKEADELRQEAGKIAGEIEQQRQRGRDVRPEQRRGMPREEAERRESRKTERPRANAERVEIERQQRSRRRQATGGAEQMEHRVAELRKRAERAEQEGHRDEADEFRQHARKLTIEIEGNHRQPKARTKEQIEHLHAMAADAKAAGQYDRADAIYREAKELEWHLRNAGAPKMENGQRNRLERQIEQLRDQVNGLRKEIEELKEIVRNRAMER